MMELIDAIYRLEQAVEDALESGMEEDEVRLIVNDYLRESKAPPTTSGPKKPKPKKGL